MTACNQLIFGSDLQQESIELRSRILRKPLGLSFSTDELEKEADQYHLGVFRNDQLCGVLLLKPQKMGYIKMRQVAIDTPWQGKGIGKELVAFAENFSKSLGFHHMILHARESAVPFYLTMNYHVEGDVFEEVGIPHYKMSKKL
jgi:predicted GNAT family N-acyltransferase